MKYSLLILFIVSAFVLTAQDSTMLYGKVVSSSKPLYGTTIKKLASNTGTITNFEGDFTLDVVSGDSIQISSIGYKPVFYRVPDTLKAEKFRILVNMIPDTVTLRETVIVPWPVNRTMLKQAMLDDVKPKETVGAFAGFREIEGDPTPPSAKLTNPISFIFEKLGKKARQEKKMEKYRKMLEEDDYFNSEVPK